MFPAQMFQGGVCVADCYPLGLFELLPFALGIGLALLTRRWRYVPIAAAIGLTMLFGLELAWRALALGERPFAYIGFLPTIPEQAAAIYLYLFLAILATIAAVFAIKRALAWVAFGDASLVVRGLAFLVMFVTLGLGAFAFAFIRAPDLLPRRLAERAHEFAGDAPKLCTLSDARPVVGLPLFGGRTEPARPANVVVGMPEAYAAFPAVYTTWMSFEHSLTRVEVIHVPDVKRYEPLNEIAVEVAVSETGDVLAVKPTAGPSDLYARAIDIASRWKFLPFIRDGKAVPARLVRAFVPVGGPELWGTRVEMPRFSDWDAVDIRLERRGYEDGFTLEIRGDGSVEYDGDGEWLALKGRHCAVVPRETIKALVEEIKRSDFFSMQGRYEAETPVDVSIALDDSVKQVRVYRALSDEEKRQTPEKLWRLVDAVLEAVHADRWVKGDKFTAPSLVAERWDFTRNDYENVWMLSDVARGGDVQAVRDLLALGAPIPTAAAHTSFGPYPPRPRPTALALAAERGAFDIVRMLLDAPIHWSADALGGAYVGALAQGNGAMADELLARGANPLARGSHQEMTALMAAALSGLPDAVAAELKRKVEVNGQAGGVAALHWAAGVDYPRSVDPMRANRRRVIDMLIKAGAKTEIESGNGTPLIANWMGLEEVTDALIEHGANVNAVGYEGETALMTNKSVRSVQLLLAAGADPYVRNQAGQNALDVARADVFAQDIVLVLERWMAAHPQRR